MQEGISYMAGAELPGLIVNVVRGGPGLGTIQPSQADYFQSTKGGGHGDYHAIVLAPASVQEMSDFVKTGFDLAFKYRTPVIIQSDGAIGQMMEKVELFESIPRWTDEEIVKMSPWAVTGKTPGRKHNIITSLNLVPELEEKLNLRLQEKYRAIEANEVQYEEINCEDAEYLFVAYGLSSRICQKAIQLGREKGIKLGLLRPITLYPFPSEILLKLAGKVKGMLCIEMSAGQMVEDVRLAVENKVKVSHYGRFGGIIPSPEEVLKVMINQIIGEK